MSSRLSFFLGRTRRVANESVELFRALWSGPPGQHRSVLIAQARSNNSLAESIVRCDKEANLLRYHGLFGYLKERRIYPISMVGLQNTLGFSSLPTNQGSGGSTEETKKGRDSLVSHNGNQSVAKIAFMVTAKMKRELVERLGYDVDMIKKMKPMEANLALHHSLPPSRFDSDIPGLVEEFQRQQEKLKVQTSPVKDVESPNDDTSETIDPITTSTSNETGRPLLIESKNMTHGDEAADLPTSADAGNSESGTLWYEVVETNATGEPNVLGLYLSLAEANACCKTYEELAHKKEGPYQYEVREVVKA